jgi:hypothetical protein
VLEPQYKTKVVPGGNGIFNPMIVVDGRIVGTWKRTLKKSSVSITAQPFTALSPAEMEGFAAAAQGYADFLGLTLDLL